MESNKMIATSKRKTYRFNFLFKETSSYDRVIYFYAITRFLKKINTTHKIKIKS